MEILNRINSPADLKPLGKEELRTLCAELREYIIECCSKNPGHLGASLGAVEIAVAVHKVFDTPADTVVWDVGRTRSAPAGARHSCRTAAWAASAASPR